MTTQTTRPAVGGGGQGLGSSLPGSSWLHPRHCIPVALAVSKRGRRCVVAKLTRFIGDHELVLAVAWRSQQGTKAAISMPVAVLDYARQRGVTRFYLRDDRRMQMRGCDLATFERGQLRADGERYIPLSWLQPVPWRQWAYAKQIVELTGPEPVTVVPQQMSLF